MQKVNFVSYSGNYPNLCSGVLILEFDGNEYGLRASDIMSSGGNVSFSDDWEEEVTDAPWIVYTDMLPLELQADGIWEQVENIINANISHGCCGGCV